MGDNTSWTDVHRDVRNTCAITAIVSATAVWLETLTRRAAARGGRARHPLEETRLLGPRRTGALAGHGTVAVDGAVASRTAASATATRFEGPAGQGRRFELIPRSAPWRATSVRWTFESQGFGLYPEAIVVFSAPATSSWRDGSIGVAKTVSTARRSGSAVVDVELDRSANVVGEVVLTPAASARLAPSTPLIPNPTPVKRGDDGEFPSTVELRLDALYAGIARGAFVVVDVAPGFLVADRALFLSRVTEVVVEPPNPTTPPLTTLTLELDLGDAIPDPQSLRVHFDLVPAGRLADLPKSTVDVADLRAGLAVVGPVDPPEGRTTVEQAFLLEDADGKGARVRGRLVFDAAERSARFTLLDDAAAVAVSTFKPPLSLYDGLVTLTEGETVEREVLGSGDGRRARQSFELARKPLTHLPAPLATDPPLSTLRIFVDGIAWEERETFYGAGPNERVFVVEHAADGTATVIFGDGRRGARLPTGTNNVVARYRFGAGAPVPEPGTLRLLGAPKVRIRSPLPFTPGRPVTPDDALVDEARTHALMLDRPVSAADFAALAVRQGAARAEAELAWLEDASTVGVRVVLIAPSDPDSEIKASLVEAAEPGTLVRVVYATPLRLRLALTVQVSSRRLPSEVRDAVCAALIGSRGVLHVSRAPLGRVVFSTVHAAVLAVPGVIGLSAAEWTFGHAAPLTTPLGAHCLPNPTDYVALVDDDLELTLHVDEGSRVIPREEP